jgi:L-aminoadipate-semialdehyde dehydrogenase
MPLNPNGKIDKPALPFPDTALQAPVSASAKSQKLTPTQKTIHDVWMSLLPAPPGAIELDENFFDLGGHSILATRATFELRKAFVVDVPLGLVFDQPTIGGLASSIEALRNDDLGFAGDASDQPKGHQGPAVDTDYAKDVDVLLPSLPEKFAELPADYATKKVTVFLTGATGFLGAFILNDLLAKRSERVAKVICLVRAKSSDDAMKRLEESGQGRGVWDSKWHSEGKVEAVVGDLSEDNFGLSDLEWKRCAEQADVVLHNGAVVSGCIICSIFRTIHLTKRTTTGTLGIPLLQDEIRQRSVHYHCPPIVHGTPL